MIQGKRSLPSNITIVQATLADANTIVDIHEEAARWLVSRGIQQWLPGDFSLAPLLAHIERGEVYLAQCEGEPLGTCMLQWSDPATWGELPDDAGYVHGLAIRRSVAGQGVGREMLRFAEIAAKTANKTYLRVDCMAKNAALRAYYEAAGFTERRDISHDEWSALYEKQLMSTPRQTIATPYGPLTIAQAQPADVDAIVAIWDEADRWMLARGVTPGQPPLPLREIVAARVSHGETYVAKRGAEVVATITLEWADDGVWCDDPAADEDALYVHGLATKRDCAGQGIGHAMLQWAETAAKTAKKPNLRLDCEATNAALRHYYEGVGFTHRGDVSLAHRVAARYEKQL